MHTGAVVLLLLLMSSKTICVLQGPALTDEQVLKLCRGVITAQLSQYAASIQAKCSQGCPINNRTLIGPPGARGPPGSPGQNVGQGVLVVLSLIILVNFCISDRTVSTISASIHQGKPGKPGSKGARGAQGDRGLEGQEGTPGIRGTVRRLIKICGLKLHRSSSNIWVSTCRSERSQRPHG